MRFFSLFILSLLTSHSALFAQDEEEHPLSKAETRFYEGENKIQSAYRDDLAKALGQADRIEVYLLDFESVDTPSNSYFWEDRLEEGEFPIIPYGNKTKVLKKLVLTKEQGAEFLLKLQKAIGVKEDPGTGAACHFPIHGVRVFLGEQILFQSSFCWKCHNFGLSYPNGSTWVGIEGDGQLREAFCKLMPIPQAELDRFQAKYGKKGQENQSEEKE